MTKEEHEEFMWYLSEKLSMVNKSVRGAEDWFTNPRWAEARNAADLFSELLIMDLEEAGL